MCRLALRAATAFAAMDTSLWIECVRSLEIPVDVLSRDALDGLDVQRHLMSGEWALDSAEDLPALHDLDVHAAWPYLADATSA